MSNLKYSRRGFLAAAGGGAALLPMLEADLTHAAGGVPRRFFTFFFGNGVIHENFWPQGSGDDLAGLTLPSTTAPLNPHKKDLLFIGGLEYRNFRGDRSVQDYLHGHASVPHILTGTRGIASPGRDAPKADGSNMIGGGLTLDQYIANVNASRRSLKSPLLTLGVDSASDEWQVSFFSHRAANQPNLPELDPWRLYTRLFGDLGQDAARLQSNLKRKKSVLDHVGRSIERFSQTVGAADRHRIEQHLSSLRTIESELATTSNTGCSAPNIGTAPIKNGSGTGRGARQDEKNYPAILSSHMKLATHAMACDMTAAATLMFGDGAGDFIFPWLGGEFLLPALAGNAGEDRTQHDLAHASGNVLPSFRNDESVKLKIVTETWMVSRFAELIQMFKDHKEADGTSMLDNSVLLMVNNMSVGDHKTFNVPWLMAGKGGGAIRTGRYMKVGAWPGGGLMGACAPHNGALVAISNALAGEEKPYFGSGEWGGELAGIRQ